FGPFVGCSRYPDCKFIKKYGPPPPDPLPFEVICPKDKDGHLVPRRARRTGNVFWGCSNYPRCDFTTNQEPLGGLHDTDHGPLARKDEAALCLICGSTSETPAAEIVPGVKYAGGPPNPEALVRPARARGGPRAGGTTRTVAKGRGKPRSTTRPATKRTRPVEPAADA
ncbi:MAG: type I DNA topoisomerase, partial [Chloroflexota bacterium]